MLNDPYKMITALKTNQIAAHVREMVQELR